MTFPADEAKVEATTTWELQTEDSIRCLMFNLGITRPSVFFKYYQETEIENVTWTKFIQKLRETS